MPHVHPVPAIEEILASLGMGISDIARSASASGFVKMGGRSGPRVTWRSCRAEYEVWELWDVELEVLLLQQDARGGVRRGDLDGKDGERHVQL